MREAKTFLNLKPPTAIIQESETLTSEEGVCMGTMIEALLGLQSVERQLNHVQNRLRIRKNAVTAQEKRIQQLREDHDALIASSLERRKKADELELDLQHQDQEVAKLRNALNAAKTNKEYAALLTQINTIKADNSKIEEEVLKTLQEVDAIKAQAKELEGQISTQEQQLAEVAKSSQDDIDRLTAMFDDLKAKRSEAATQVPPDALRTFERIAATYGGEAMAVIEAHGKRPPFDYICGGCFMSLNAEHVNALRVRDEIRTCNNCGRILYIEPQEQESVSN